MGTYRDLIAWQKAMDLVDAVYVAVRQFPRSEIFCMSLQLRKAALSVALNIAEGRGRYSLPDQRHFLRQARGSACEVETLIEAASRQGFLSPADSVSLVAKANEVARLVSGLLRSIS